MCICVQMEVKGKKSDVISQESFILFFWDRVSYWPKTWQLGSVGWPANYKDLPVFTSPESELQAHIITPDSLPGSWNHIFRLVQKTLYQLSYRLNPTVTYYSLLFLCHLKKQHQTNKKTSPLIIAISMKKIIFFINYTTTVRSHLFLIKTINLKSINNNLKLLNFSDYSQPLLIYTSSPYF